MLFFDARKGLLVNEKPSYPPTTACIEWNNKQGTTPSIDSAAVKNIVKRKECLI